jgi:putative spermidine/putrescine transport system ATP-binding protein
VAVAGVDLLVRRGEFITLLGPSGSGKTTMLSLIAGLVAPTEGRILIDGVDATELPSSRRGLGMVFQNYALLPHLTIFENVAFPLRVRRRPRAEIERRVTEALELVQLGAYRHRKPRELSGGQQQRAAIARCIVYSPAITLMDEPLGALDKRLREQMQLELTRLHAQLGMTVLYVTHDQQEALTMSDRIVLMNGGRVEQVGTPAELYAEPRSRFAAEFVGDSNLLAGVVTDGGGPDPWITLDGGARVRIGPAPGLRPGQPVTLMLRPESVTILDDGAAARADVLDANVLGGTLDQSIILGPVVRHHVRLPDGGVLISAELNRRTRAGRAPGAAVRLAWRPADAVVLPWGR